MRDSLSRLCCLGHYGLWHLRDATAYCISDASFTRIQNLVADCFNHRVIFNLGDGSVGQSEVK
jgi:hypothetical protein